MQNIVIATSNNHKIEELEKNLTPSLNKLFNKVRLQKQTDFYSDKPKEDGLSFIENALIKARFASEKTKLPAVADDSGIEVNLLAKYGGLPSIYSSRFYEKLLRQELQLLIQDLGKKRTNILMQYLNSLPKGLSHDTKNNLALVKVLRLLKTQKFYYANYYCVLVLVKNALDATPAFGVGKLNGLIVLNPKGNNGFGYDPYFYLPKLNKHIAELSLETKQKISHRQKALQDLITKFE